MDIFGKLQADRAVDVQFWRKHPELRKQLVDDAYPQKAHFIYELLQNAEDAKAKKAVFSLSKNGLELRHDGKRTFTEADIEAITDVSKSGKPDNGETIGKFGIGFKSVFKYTETPHIYSGQYSFKITNFVYPQPLAPLVGLGSATIFVFPFDNPQKPPTDAFDEIAAGLSGLAETTLLFLTNLECITWEIDGYITGEVLRVTRLGNHVEVSKRVGTETVQSSHFLLFAAPVTSLPTQNVAIAFELNLLPSIEKFDTFKPLCKQLKIVPAMQGRVAVFFPADDEKSELRFHVHAPFVPVLSRASIKETEANIPLFQQLAKVAASSLYTVKELELLTSDFLAVLPNPQDPIPERYQPIRTAIIDEMKNKPLTPTFGKSFAPAKYLLQAKNTLKELLSSDALAALAVADGPTCQWAINPTSKSDRFLAGLEIRQWDLSTFIAILKTKASTEYRSISAPPFYKIEPEEKFMEWLAGMPTAWLQQFYAFLYKEVSPTQWHGLKDLQIIRLSDGSYTCGKKTCFFPTGRVEHDPLLPRVDVRVYTSGDDSTEQEASRAFLEKLGVREVGEVDEVCSILKKRYTSEAFAPDMKDLERFVSLLEKNSLHWGIFKDYYIFHRSDGKWGKPSQTFIDTPFIETELASYYNYIEESSKRAISDSYLQSTVTAERFVRFAKAVGVQTQLVLLKVSCCDNPKWDVLRKVAGNRYTSTGKDTDYIIPQLDKLLVSPSVSLSKLVWRTMRTTNELHLRACYSKNETRGCRYEDSQIVHLLRSAAWVPQKNGKFVVPADASPNNLPDGFPFDAGEKWLSAIGFGDNENKFQEDTFFRNEAAKKVGFDCADEASQWASLAHEIGYTPDEVRKLLLRKTMTVQPEGAVPDPERRRRGVLDRRDNAPAKESVSRERKIQAGLPQEILEARAYLRAKYTNANGQLICQCCHQEMPFRVKGHHYFEAVQCIRDLPKHHYENRLALCPLCSAMYRHARGTGDIEVIQSILNNDCPDTAASVAILVKLADAEFNLHFVGTHWFDLKTILGK
ncbi:sacsin N-terminal ATP-binding-like domain-containing protein [Geomonas subterranea]|uniref:sacsin N-terminal ATP-binding-like domain-containing protein n=1 Tax=Geomonas subterranea TaxID=2847989 RepID=UPI001CD2A72D|nr:hypothetical protein [Geomonas fuzhouensis]